MSDVSREFVPDKGSLKRERSVAKALKFLSLVVSENMRLLILKLSFSF